MQAEIISLASRRVARPDGMRQLERQDAIARLSRRVTAGAIIYVVLRTLEASRDVMHCDFYLIDGDRIACISDDVASALDRHDGEAGAAAVRVVGARGHEILRDLIDFSLSRVLFGQRSRIRNQIIR